MARRSTIARVLFGIAVAMALVAGIIVAVRASSGGGGSEIHVSGEGDDGASGESAEHAWRSLDRLAGVDVAPGTTIVIHGDVTGSLPLVGLAGTADAPIVVTSAPDERARISAVGDAGIRIIDSSFVTVTGIDVVDGTGANEDGAGSKSPEKADQVPDGVFAWASDPDAPNEGVRIEDVSVTGLRNGVAVGAAGNGAGFEGITVQRVLAADNIRNGILFYSDERGERAHSDVTVAHSEVTGTTGVTGAHGNTGNGIAVGAVDGGIVEHNLARGNGALSDAPEGPIGIWGFSSSKLAIRDNVSEENSTTRADGGGFALDLDVDHSSLERNLSRDNAGPGFLVFANDGIATSANSMMFNASIGDATMNAFHGGISIRGGLPQSPEGSAVDDLYVAHNTVVMGEDSPAPALSLGGTVEGIRILSNFFDVRGSGPVIGAADAAGEPGVELCGNAYAPGPSRSLVRWTDGMDRIDPDAWWAEIDESGSAVTDSRIRDLDGDARDFVPDAPVDTGAGCGAAAPGDAIDLAGEKIGEAPLAGAVRP